LNEATKAVEKRGAKVLRRLPHLRGRARLGVVCTRTVQLCFR